MADKIHQLDEAVSRRLVRLENFTIERQDSLVAITTPIPDQLGNVSAKTPIFHLPIYKVNLNGPGATQANQEEVLEFHCDLADLTDLIMRLKLCLNEHTNKPQ